MRHATLLSLILALTAHAETARWADATIPLKEGLELWLDASRENEAREAHYMNRLADAQAMEVWHDSSGKSRHLTQWSSVFRPLWRNGAVEFLDDDYLATLISPGLESRECTIFIVASPTRADGDFPGMFSAARRDENDYTSGLALDFGRTPGPEGFADWLNVEGAGQTGARNLLISPIATGKGHLFTVTRGQQGTQLRADGTARGQRERGKVAFAMDRVAVGALRGAGDAPFLQRADRGGGVLQPQARRRRDRGDGALVVREARGIPARAGSEPGEAGAGQGRAGGADAGTRIPRG